MLFDHTPFRRQGAGSLPPGSGAPSHWQRRLPRPLRDPFVLFLVVSAVVFGVYWAVSGRTEVIEVSPSVQRSLDDDYLMMTGRAPTAAARAKLVRDYTIDEILFRESIRRGMHMTDKATRQRLIDRVRFMIAGAPPEPNEETLIDYYSEHNDLYRSEPQTSLTHVFFEKLPADPAAVLARLSRGEAVVGDDFWMGKTLPNYGESMLRGMFGQPFVAAVQRAPIDRWIGPLASSRGAHFVRVTARREPALLPYPMVRDQVRQDFLAAQSDALVNREVAKLQEGYHVVVER